MSPARKMPRTKASYHLEDGHGAPFGDPIAHELQAQRIARRECSESRPIVRVLRLHPTQAPRRLLVFRATWSVAAGKALCSELYEIS